MKRSTFKIFLVLVLAFAPLCEAIGQAAVTAPAITELDVNGMKVLIKRRPGTPTVSAGLFFKGGVRNMTPENAGIESFTLQAAAEGSKSFLRARLRKETSRIGTLISPGSNYDYSALALASTKENFETSWRM